MEVSPPLHRLDPKAVARLLTDQNALATPLHIICLRTYGEAVHQMDPVEIWLSLEEDFGVELPLEVEARINAIFIATTTDAFYHDQEAFRAITLSLCDGDPSLELLEVPEPQEVLWACYEVGLNRPEVDFAPDVGAFLAQLAARQGVDGTDPDAYLGEMRDILTSQLTDLGIRGITLPDPLAGVLEAV